MREVSEPNDPSARDVLARYPGLRDDHLRYLEQWGLVRPTKRRGAPRTYGFADLAVIRQTSAAIADGRSFRAIVRQLEAERHGQLAFDFRLDAQPARVLTLPARERSAPASGGQDAQAAADISQAEALFAEASALDAEEDGASERAADLYRRALVIDPLLVAALINLGNLHYARGHLPEALALYEQATGLAPDFFEAHYNRANVLHDVGRYEDACEAYREALTIEPSHADGHFYLAVTLEKLGASAEARPHWQVYRTLAPQGAWAELAREFMEKE
jgi:tetratricopeptide (TPR) repeat protein